MPKVTVIIPVFNGKRYVREALESVFAQTYRDYEVICIDDGSTDGSAEFLLSYNDCVTVIRQANQGQGAARNAGIAQAAGQYIAFLDQDDRWYPSKLEREVRTLDENPAAVLAYSNSDRIDSEGQLIQVGATLTEQATAMTSPLGRLIGEGLVLPSSMLVRTEILERVSGFDPELTGYEDFDLCARLRLHGRFIFLQEQGLCYRVHHGGFSQAGGIRVVRSRERFLLRMKALYAGNDFKQCIIRTMLGECYSDWGMHHLRAGDCRAARRSFLRSLFKNPMKGRTYSRLMRTFLPRRPAHNRGGH